MELDDLYDRLRELKERKREFFQDDDDPHYGDGNYQHLLMQIDEVEEQIEELENEDE